MWRRSSAGADPSWPRVWLKIDSGILKRVTLSEYELPALPSTSRASRGTFPGVLLPPCHCCTARAVLQWTLLLFCPSRTSTTWPRIAEIGSFCVSLLAAHQEGVPSTSAGRSADRFAGLNWSETRLGHPALAGSLGWIDCTIEASHPAGDHDVGIARAEAWGCREEPVEPLIFFGGKYQPAA